MEERSPFGSADGFYTLVHFIDCHEVSTNTTAYTWGRSKSITSDSAFWSSCPQERGRGGHSSLGRTLPALQEHRAAGTMPHPWDGHCFGSCCMPRNMMSEFWSETRASGSLWESPGWVPLPLHLPLQGPPKPGHWGIICLMFFRGTTIVCMRGPNWWKHLCFCFCFRKLFLYTIWLIFSYWICWCFSLDLHGAQGSAC